MAEEPQVIRGINWRDVFPFTHIFRGFRIAIHPSKLVLALLALLSLYIGGRLLDALWSSQWRAVHDEIALYEASPDVQTFRERREASREQTLERAARFLERNKTSDEKFNTYEKSLQQVQSSPSDAYGHVAWEIRRNLRSELDSAKKRYEEQGKQIDDARGTAPDDAARRALDERRRDLDNSYRQEQRRLFDEARVTVEQAEAIRGQGLFEAFFDYQSSQINRIIQGILAADWLGEGGVLSSVFKFFTVAPSWALRHHWLYFILFGAMFLVVWSLFGGAIARIAAVHVADEGRKLSVRQGLNFSTSKFLSFISAPLIPLIIVLGLGLVIAVGGLLLYIPWVGDIIVGGLFFLALAAGFVMTLVLLGTVGGLNLMYPTIAVEGSDSFDAISRSFSYVYARPWRMLFYSLVALVYGALCYLFIRLFIFLMLVLTRFFVGLLVYRGSPDTRSYWEALFPGPVSIWRLPFDVNYELLGWSGVLAAFLISMWVYLVIAMLGAFAISFYFSVSTIIYYLMRREVDAAEMDDVYLEQPEEDFAETPLAAAPAGASADSAPPATTTASPPASDSPGAAQAYPAPDQQPPPPNT